MQNSSPNERDINMQRSNLNERTTRAQAADPPQRMRTRVMSEKKRKPSQLEVFKKSPKGYLLGILLVLTIVGEWNSDPVGGLKNIIIAVATGLVVDISVAVYQKRKRIFPDGAVITGLIIALVLGSDVPWYQTVVTTLFALISKHVLVSGRKPIFNPAVFGLFFALLLFQSDESWWGSLTLLPWWFTPLLIISGFIITNKVQKFPQVLTFLAVYLGLFLIISLMHYKNVSEIFLSPFINSALFLAFFMLTDPPTSPGKDKDQVIFSCIAAVISVGCYVFFGGLSYLFIGLLVSNGWKAWKAKKASQLRKQKQFA
jgi:Na+-translocating ferredoxin:NAD+ oxidoreductase RnfD subunit